MMDLCSLVAHETAHGIVRHRFKEFNYHTPIKQLTPTDNRLIKDAGKYFETEFWLGIKPNWAFPKDKNKAEELAKLIYDQVNKDGNVLFTE